MVGDTLRLRFDPPLREAPLVARDGVSVAPLLTGGAGEERWVLRGFRAERREAVTVRSGETTWHLATVEGHPAPVELVEIGPSGGAVVHGRRAVRVRWKGADGGEWTHLGGHTEELPVPASVAGRFPWVLEWEERGVSGVVALDPSSALTTWARGLAEGSRPGRMQRRWTLGDRGLASYAGATPLDIVEPLRVPTLRALQDPVLARNFSNFIEDWRIFRAHFGPDAGGPEACWDAPAARPRRTTARPPIEPLVQVEGGPDLGKIYGVMSNPFKHFVEPPGTLAQLAQLRWPSGLPVDGDLAVVIQVRPASPRSWYFLIELRPNKRFFLLAFPPPACGAANPDGYQYLTWTFPARLAPPADRFVYLREYRPEVAPTPGTWHQAWVGRAAEG